MTWFFQETLNIDEKKPSDKEKSINYVKSEYYEGDFSKNYGLSLNDGANGKKIYLHFEREYDGANWMSGIDDDVFLSDLSIPGAHDCVCYQIGLANDFVAQTQNHYVGSGDYVGYWNGKDDQTTRGLLDRGVRFIDLRIKWESDHSKPLITGHGFEIARYRTEGSLTFTHRHTITLDKVWEWVRDFLKNHPTGLPHAYAESTRPNNL